MTQIIDYDGVQHKFPDDFTREDIKKALESLPADFSARFPQQQQQTEKPGALAKMVEPITSIPSTYNEMVKEAVSRMGRGVEQIGQGDVLSGVGNTALGAANYVTAPINAPIHTIVGKPLEENFGVPSQASDLVASMVLPIPKGLPRFGKAGGVAEKAVPSVEQLKSAAEAGFKSPEVAALEIKPQALQVWSDGLRAKLTEDGLDENTAPKTWAIIRGLDKSPEGATVTGKNLQSLRRTFGRAAGTADASERKAAGDAIKSLDSFVVGIPQNAVVSGDPAKVGQIWNDARGNYAAAKRSEQIDAAIEDAELQAGSAHSGQNIDNATRQRIKAILRNPKARRGYSGEELRQMKRVVMGTYPGDAARFVGNLLGGGGGLGMTATAAMGTGIAGAAARGPIGAMVGAAMPVAGYAFKKLGNALTARQVNDLQTLIRSRSPLADQMRGPIEDWSKAAVTLEASPTPRNIARVLVASRNLSNNLKDAGITLSADDLIRSIQGPVSTPAGETQQQPEGVGNAQP